MRQRPEALDEHALRQALHGWGLADARLTYAPVGFGDYHWIAEPTGPTGPTGPTDPSRPASRAFITVVDLYAKEAERPAAEVAAGAPGAGRATETAPPTHAALTPEATQATQATQAAPAPVTARAASSHSTRPATSHPPHAASSHPPHAASSHPPHAASSHPPHAASSHPPHPAFTTLRSALDTAAALRAGPCGEAVVAPLPSADGERVRRVDARYAVSVFPYESGVAGEFGRWRSAAERHRVLDLLATLHRSPVPAGAVHLPPHLSARGALERALADVRGPWRGGPYAEPARALVLRGGDALRGRLAEFDGLLAEVAGRGAAPVVTHGEPHAGNVLFAGDRPRLVDWDTVGLAVPERDLWLVAEGPADLDRYARASGREPDPAALALYALRWELEDVAAYLDWFRAPHERTADTEVAWAGLSGTVRALLAR
ncbi:phosphotransferase [Streptomyces sp. HSW2009]|uniref:phosphotransferase n=1 Tax=Streptomyces sp. HSW2009 TaxID=3142890 RepID=UPI0032ECCC3E